MSSRSLSRPPVTPHKGQKPAQPPRPSHGGRPLAAQHVIVTGERRDQPDLRLIARAIIRLAQHHPDTPGDIADPHDTGHGDGGTSGEVPS